MTFEYVVVVVYAICILGCVGNHAGIGNAVYINLSMRIFQINPCAGTKLK